MSATSRNRFIRIIVAVSLGAALAGCVTVPPEEDPVLIKLRELDTRLGQVERILENQGLVSMLAEMQGLQGELADLRNDVETLSFESEGARNRQRDLYVDLDGRLNNLEQGLASPSAAGSGGDAAGGDGRGSVSDRDAYKAAFGLLEEGRYTEAGASFASFIGRYPNSSLVDNAQYWYAEALYVERQFGQALTEFKRVVDVYPDSRKIPDALLKIGYSHNELKQFGEARAALERVTSDYPESTAARLAAQRLEKMTGEGR